MVTEQFSGDAIREAYERLRGQSAEYRAALRLVEDVRDGMEEPQEARERIMSWKRANRLTGTETKKLLEQLSGMQDVDEEAGSVRHCPPPKALQKRPSANFIALAKLIKSGAVEAETLRQAICDSAKGGTIYKGEQRRLFSMLDRAVARQNRNTAMAAHGNESEVFVEGPMDSRGGALKLEAAASKPSLFRRPVAGERREVHSAVHPKDGNGTPGPLKTVREGLVMVNAGSRGILIGRSR